MFAEPSAKTQDLLQRMRQFFDQHILLSAAKNYFRRLALATFLPTVVGPYTHHCRCASPDQSQLEFADYHIG